MDPDRVKALIIEAFATVERPGNWALVGSTEGDEPQRLEEEFRDKEDWRSPAEARAILEYLRFRAEGDEFERSSIEQAIENYWNERAV